MAAKEQQANRTGVAVQAFPKVDRSPDQKRLLRKRIMAAWAAQHAYFERSSILNAMNFLIGVPVVVITA